MKHLVFDTETTGIPENSLREPDKQPRIIEITMATWDDEKDTVYTVNAMFNPGMPISPKVSKVTGITDATVKDLAPFNGENATTIRDMIEIVDVVVAHNLSFDKLIIDNELKRIGERTPNWPRGICTIESTEHIMGYRMKLGDLHQYLFAKPIEGAHRAQADVEALLRCYQELIKRGEI